MPTYYVKKNGGTGSGIDDTNAWNLAKLVSTTIPVGSTVLFKRDEVYDGRITMELTGNPGNITFGTYGTGRNPKFTVLQKMTGWTLHSGNIYYVPLDVPTLNIVLLNNEVKKMGRYPTSTYLAHTSHSGNTSITASSVSLIPFNPAGGEVVIRKNRYIIDRHPIVSRSGNTINYSTNNDYGNNNQYEPSDLNGFFIQNHIGCLTAHGDWSYDKVAKRLYMYFTGSPNNVTVKASTQSNNLYLNYWQNITFNNLDFEGGNIDGTYFVGTSNITLNNCNFTNQGGNAMYAIDVTNVNINNCSITNSLNNGVFYENNCNNITVNNLSTKNCGIIEGAGRSGDGAQQGVFIVGNNAYIHHSKVINSGYLGIGFNGDNGIVEDNYVDYHGLIKDDSGGIYTYIGLNGIIRRNLVKNAIGKYSGGEWGYWEPFGKAAGIYLDNGVLVHNAQVYDNVVINADWAGIFNNNTAGNHIYNNTIIDCRYGFLFTYYSSTSIGTIFNNNKVVSTQSYQIPFYLHLFSSSYNVPATMQVYNNMYYRPSSDSSHTVRRQYEGISDTETNMTLKEFQTLFGLEENSTSNAKLLTLGGKMLTVGGKLLAQTV